MRPLVFDSLDDRGKKHINEVAGCITTVEGSPGDLYELTGANNVKYTHGMQPYIHITHSNI